MKKITDENLMIDYLRDESRKSGDADEVVFPESEEEVIEFLRQRSTGCLTTQGTRTGVTAGCVPFGGTVMSMERMNKVIRFTEERGTSENGRKTGTAGASDGEPFCTAVVQPGLALQVFRDELFKRNLFFTPDPTEVSASIGGMISCNSSGARSYRYGPVRGHVRSVRVVLRDGDVLKLTRGAEKAKGLDFCLRTESGREISGRLPDIRMPDVSKHTAGYYIRPDMDMIDLFIGSEGTLGVITEAELALYPAPKNIWGCVVFLDSEDQALSFVEAVRAADEKAVAGAGDENRGSGYVLRAEAIEYFDHDTLELIRTDQQEGAVLQELPPVPEGKCAIYVEHISEDKSLLQSTYEALKKMVTNTGGRSSDAWVASGIVQFEKLKDFRHAAPVCVNHRIAEIRNKYPEITKLGTDMSVPDGKLRQVMSMYREGLDCGAFKSIVFGHIGNNHLHVNIIPHDMDEYTRGKDMYRQWAKKVVEMGGSVSAEHGIGKLKIWLLEELYKPEQLDEMHELKKIFDPDELLDRGNVFTV